MSGAGWGSLGCSVGRPQKERCLFSGMWGTLKNSLAISRRFFDTLNRGVFRPDSFLTPFNLEVFLSETFWAL